MARFRKFSVDSQVTIERGVIVTKDHFGSNVVTKYDEDFSNGESIMSALTKEIGVHTLRYPGGSVTELLFDMTSPNDRVSFIDSKETLLPMDGFFQEAAAKGMNVSMVLPTRMAFGIDAADAMADGSYGAREDVSPQYLRKLLAFVETVVEEAATYGVTLTGFEIGNEFWGSGQMTAVEYGRVVGAVAPVLEKKLLALGMRDVDIIAQSHSSASRLYSPREDVPVYIGTKHGMSWAFTEEEIESQYGGVVPAGWTKAIVPGQGPAYQQLLRMAEEINRFADAPDAIDGLVQHYYQSEGFAGVDQSHDFFFSQFSTQEKVLDRSADAEPLALHVSEWNTHIWNAEQNKGSQHASMMVENFFELVSNGVQSAHIWPLTFDTTQTMTLLSKAGNEVTLSGEMFRLMSESLTGLIPVLDWAQEGVLDIHGFSDQNRSVFFVSERSGADQDNISVSFSDLPLPENFFVTGTELWDDGAGGSDPKAKAAVLYSDGKTGSFDTLEFDIHAWANLRIEITEVGAGADHVVGRGGNDTIRGFGGNDRLYGGGGADELRGDEGEDVIYGGVGDDLIYGGIGYDVIYGGDGADTVWGGNGQDKVYLGAGNDVFHDSIQNDRHGADLVKGGEGNDTFYDGGGNDTYHGEGGHDLFVFSDRHGRDTIADFTPGQDHIRFDITDLQFADLTFQAQGSDLRVETDSGTILLYDLARADLGADDFLFS